MFEGLAIYMMHLCKYTQKKVSRQKILIPFPVDEKANYKPNISLLASYFDYIVSTNNNVCYSSEILTDLNEIYLCFRFKIMTVNNNPESIACSIGTHLLFAEKSLKFVSVV